MGKERKLRRLAISLLPLLLSPVPSSLLSPLHSLLLAHLCCSPTHIDPRIQQDGLTMLDTLLDKAPGFVKTNYNTVLPNCLDQISNKKVGEKGPSVAANMTESRTALQWRVLVLTRVDRVLNTVVRDRAESRTPSTLHGSTTLSFSPGLFCPLNNFSPPSWLSMSSLSNKTSTSSMVTNLKLLVLALDNIDGGDRETVLKLVEQKYMKDIKQHFLSHLPYTSKGKSSDQANAILCCISLAITSAMDDGMQEVVVSVATSKNTEPATRLRLARSLLLREELTVEQRDKVVLAMVKIAEVEVGKEKNEILNLLRNQAMQWPQAGVSSWVESLPNQLLLQKEVEQMELILDTCLELAKTCNRTIATQFLAKWKDLLVFLDSPMFESCKPSLVQKLHFIKHHCDLSNPAIIA